MLTMISLRTKKEVRLILPEWITAAALAMMPLWSFGLGKIIQPASPARLISEPILVICLTVACAILSAAIFGKESSAGTVDQMFMLPISRNQIWLQKVLLGVCSVGSIVLLFTVSLSITIFLLRFTRGIRPELLMQNFNNTMWLIFLCTLGPGLWFGLVLRRFHEAFWLTLLTPFGLMLATFLVNEKYFSGSSDAALYGTISLYGLITLIATFPAVRQWQDSTRIQQNLDLAFPWANRGSRSSANAKAKVRGALGALILKEFRTHQLSLVVALTLAVIYIGFLITVKRGSWYGSIASDTLGVLRTIWLLVPLTIGVAAIAEERALGIGEWHATLPISRRRQWGVKLSVVLILSFVLGSLLPWPLDHYLSTLEASDNLTSFQRVEDGFMLSLLRWGFPLVVGLVGFYASSLTRNLLQGLLVAAALLFLLWFQINIGTSLVHIRATVVPIFVFLLATTLIYTPVILFNSYRNFAHPVTGSLRLLPDMGRWCVAAVLSTTLAYLAFNRVWDRWETQPAIVNRDVLQSGEILPQARIDFHQLTIITDTGRVWSLGESTDPSSASRMDLHPLAGSTPFLSVGTSSHRRYAIDFQNQLFAWDRNTEKPQPAPAQLTKLNESDDWVQLDVHHPSHNVAAQVYALRQNGQLHLALDSKDKTMSRFETLPIDVPLASFRVTEHYRIAITQEGRLALIGPDPMHLWRHIPQPGQAEGSNTLTYLDESSDWSRIHIVPEAIYLAETGFQNPMRAFLPTHFIGPRAAFPIAILEQKDGSFWTTAWVAQFAYGESTPGVDDYTLVRLKRSPFLSIARQDLARGGMHKLIAVRADGTLWQGIRQSVTRHSGYDYEYDLKKLKQIGTRTDWAAVSMFAWGRTIFAVTKNGILWSWGPPLHVPSYTDHSVVRIIPYRHLPEPIYDLHEEKPIH